MPQEIKFEDGSTIPWPDNPTAEDYHLLDVKEREIKNLKNDVKSSIKPNVLKAIEKFGWESIAPTTGALIGTMGGAWAPVTIPIGSFFGTWLNQQLGITERDYLSLVLSAGVPGTIAPTKATLKGLTKRLPGAHAALNELAIERARSITGKYPITVPSKTLFQKVSSYGVTFKNDKVLKQIDKSLKEEMKLSTPNSDLIGDLTRLRQRLINNPNGLLANDFHEEATRWYQNNKTAFKQGTRGAHHYANIYRAFKETIDDSANIPNSLRTSPAAITLQRAINTYKTEKAIERIGEYVEKAIVRETGKDYDLIRGKQIIQALKKDKNFQTAFTPEIRKEIMQDFAKINKIPKELGLGFRAAVGAGLGALLPFTESPAINITMGAMGYELFGYVMSSEGGRQLFKKVLKDNGRTLDTKGLSVLAAYAISQYSQQPVEQKRQPKLAKERGGRQPGQIPSTQLTTRIQAEK